MDETKPVQDIEQRTSELVHEAAARGAEKLQNYDVTGGVRAFSRALHRAAESLHEDGYNSMASMTDRAADGFDRFGGSVEGKDPASLARDAQRFAHQNPTAFIFGCALVGFALARFFTTTSRETFEEEEYEPRYEPVEPVEVPVAPATYGEPLGSPTGGTR